MKIKLISGEIVKAKIKKAPARLERAYGYKKMAHWLDKNGACSIPVVKVGKEYREII